MQYGARCEPKINRVRILRCAIRVEIQLQLKRFAVFFLFAAHLHRMIRLVLLALGDRRRDRARDSTRRDVVTSRCTIHETISHKNRSTPRTLFMTLFYSERYFLAS